MAAKGACHQPGRRRQQAGARAEAAGERDIKHKAHSQQTRVRMQGIANNAINKLHEEGLSNAIKWCRSGFGLAVAVSLASGSGSAPRLSWPVCTSW